MALITKTLETGCRAATLILKEWCGADEWQIKCFAQDLEPGPTESSSGDSWIGIDIDGFAKEGGVLMWLIEIETFHAIISPPN